MGNIMGKIARGEKWFNLLEFYKFKGDKKKLDWLNSQKNILEEIELYKNSLDKSKGKK